MMQFVFLWYFRILASFIIVQGMHRFVYRLLKYLRGLILQSGQSLSLTIYYDIKGVT
jgi:hypothetical protein